MFFIRHVLPVAILSALIGIVVAKLFLGNTNEKLHMKNNTAIQAVTESADNFSENPEAVSNHQASAPDDTTAISEDPHK